MVEEVRQRFSGRRRNPFNEMECGDHYARSMASFGLLHAWSGLVYDAASNSITVTAQNGTWPIVAGKVLGQVVVRQGEARFVPAQTAQPAGGSWPSVAVVSPQRVRPKAGA